MTGFLTEYSLHVILPSIGWTLLHSIWQIMLIGCVIFIAKKLIPAKEYRWQYNLSIAGIIACLVVSLISFSSTYTELSADFECCNMLAVDSYCEIEQSLCTPLIDNGNGFIQALQSLSDLNIHLITFLWLMGFMFLMTRWVVAYYYTYRISNLSIPIMDSKVLSLMKALKQKMGLQMYVGLKESYQVNSPMVIGVLKPLILLPVGILNQLSLEETEAILAHELAHVQRYDFTFNLIQTIVEAIFYYHPVVWFLAKSANDEREICCDEIAVDTINNHHLYAMTLVKMQEIGQSGLSLGMRFSGPECQLKRRVLMILNQPLSSGGLQDKIIAGISLTTLVLGLNFYGANPINELNCFVDTTEDQCLDLETKEINEEYEFVSIQQAFLETAGEDMDLHKVLDKSNCIAKVPSSITVIDLDDKKEKNCVCPNKKRPLPSLDLDFENAKIIEVSSIASSTPKLILAQRDYFMDTIAPAKQKKIYTLSSNGVNTRAEKSTKTKCTTSTCMTVSEVRIENKYKQIHLEDDYVNIQINKGEGKDVDPIKLDLNDNRMFSLIKALRKDGLVELMDKVVKLNMTYDGLTINGEQQDDKVHQKYKAFYAENLNIPVEKESKIIFKYKS